MRSPATLAPPSRPSLCLGLESTAHTFGASLVRGPPIHILSDVKHVYEAARGSGIHPRSAAQHHVQHAPTVIRRALQDGHCTIHDVDAIAYAAGPGLGPCLRIAAVIGRALAAHHQKPLVAVHHAVGHIELALALARVPDPIVVLVTGGHTLITAGSHGRWRIFGETLDLTLGQLLDQFGRAAGLQALEQAGFGGPRIEEAARHGRTLLDLPYTVKGNDVSYSGLLTALLHALPHQALPDLCYSLQETAFAMLVEVVERALAFTGKPGLLLVGGVAANRRLRTMLQQVARRYRARYAAAPLAYTGDCGAQIAWPGLLAYRAGHTTRIAASRIRQSWRLDHVDLPWRAT